MILALAVACSLVLYFFVFFFFLRCVVVDKGERWPVVMAGGGGCWFG